ncbi:MAG: hypothetical protein AAFP89_01485 [Bacteroidota bacterium]
MKYSTQKTPPNIGYWLRNHAPYIWRTRIHRIVVIGVPITAFLYLLSFLSVPSLPFKLGRIEMSVLSDYYYLMHILSWLAVGWWIYDQWNRPLKTRKVSVWMMTGLIYLVGYGIIKAPTYVYQLGKFHRVMTLLDQESIEEELVLWGELVENDFIFYAKQEEEVQAFVQKLQYELPWLNGRDKAVPIRYVHVPNVQRASLQAYQIIWSTQLDPNIFPKAYEERWNGAKEVVQFFQGKGDVYEMYMAAWPLHLSFAGLGILLFLSILGLREHNLLDDRWSMSRRRESRFISPFQQWIIRWDRHNAQNDPIAWSVGFQKFFLFYWLPVAAICLLWGYGGMWLFIQLFPKHDILTLLLVGVFPLMIPALWLLIQLFQQLGGRALNSFDPGRQAAYLVLFPLLFAAIVPIMYFSLLQGIGYGRGEMLLEQSPKDQKKRILASGTWLILSPEDALNTFHPDYEDVKVYLMASTPPPIEELQDLAYRYDMGDVQVESILPQEMPYYEKWKDWPHPRYAHWEWKVKGEIWRIGFSNIRYDGFILKHILPDTSFDVIEAQTGYEISFRRRGEELSMLDLASRMEYAEALHDIMGQIEPEGFDLDNLFPICIAFLFFLGAVQVRWVERYIGLKPVFKSLIVASIICFLLPLGPILYIAWHVILNDLGKKSQWKDTNKGFYLSLAALMTPLMSIFFLMGGGLIIYFIDWDRRNWLPRDEISLVIFLLLLIPIYFFHLRKLTKVLEQWLMLPEKT